jgi:hypothetical protein
LPRGVSSNMAFSCLLCLLPASSPTLQAGQMIKT